MNKILCNLICAFIPNKKSRNHFRKKHSKKINNSVFEQIVDVANKMESYSLLLNDIYNKQKFLSCHNINKILSLKDKHKGEKCFIIGGSPSLKELDLTKLNNSEYKIFTVGRGYKLKDNGLSHSDFHVFSDIDGYNEIIDEIDESFADIFFSYCGINFINNVKNLIYFNFFQTPINMDKHYQDDLTQPLFHCETVINFVLQIATYMGFKDIYFIGVDLDFNKNLGHIYKSNDGEEERQISHSKNRNLFMLSSFEYAVPFLKEKGINLFNASPSGILDCMPRVKYQDLFK